MHILSIDLSSITEILDLDNSHKVGFPDRCTDWGFASSWFMTRSLVLAFPLLTLKLSNN